MNDKQHFVLNVGSSCDAVVEALAAGRLTISSPTFTRTVDLAPPSQSANGLPIDAMIFQLDTGQSGDGVDAYTVIVSRRDENGVPVTLQHKIKMQPRYAATADLPVVKEAILYWCAHPQLTRFEVVALFYRRIKRDTDAARRRCLHRALEDFEANR
jgi:hypothetical protein